MATSIREKADLYNAQWHALNTSYEEYAKSVGFTSSSLNVLCAIHDIENCTQKLICEETYLPKQTVNNVITSFYKQEYIYLVELPEDRRIKTIHFTKAGKKLADKILTTVSKAEEKSMGQFTEEEADIFLKLQKRYVECCGKNMPR